MDARHTLFLTFAVIAGTFTGAAAEIYGIDTQKAAVRDDHEATRQLRIGDELAELGEVKSIDEDEIVLERTLGEEERHDLAARGFAAPDVRRLRLRRALDVTPEDGMLIIRGE